ncbi:hypothetical protein HNY73_007426 [Argiope bruennichi]|uniref:Uncharacterized protein n=1 Tax=Argiope bruennichi TaxID=94029 RepID=A0A8T0FKY9_ARGBR|nr:hypothetical protein HNY73_007426 [Argiope bruennichi]
MGKVRDLRPRKVGRISVLLQETPLKQKEIAKKLNVSTQTISNIKKKLENGHNLASNIVEKCGRPKKTTPRMDRKTIKMAIKNRRASCRMISNQLAAKGITIPRRTRSFDRYHVI